MPTTNIKEKKEKKPVVIDDDPNQTKISSDNDESSFVYPDPPENSQ